jgi:leucyl aminopeptidase (aminopeptidase T)
MKGKWMFLVVAVALVAGLLATSIVRSSPQKGTGTDYEALAQKLVNQCASIREGDLVGIYGGVRDLELLEDIAVNVRKLGAFPLVTIGSDRMTRRMYTDVPAEYDSQSPEFDLKLTNLITAQIGVDYGETIGLLADIPPERLVATSKAWEPVNELFLKRNIREVYLGNGLYPTAALAKLYGVPQEELSKIFWEGVNVDYTKLQATGEAVKAILSKGKEVHITNPNGTDLKVRIEGRPIFVSDGVISAKDIQRGGAACQVWLPAGEVYLTPVPGTAEGKVVVDRQFYLGKEILGLTLTFKAGKLTSMTAKSGIEPLKALYDASGPGKELFAFVDIGINPNVRLVPGSRMVAWMPAGMITVGIGNNIWAGGENNTSYSSESFLPGFTLKVDEKVLVENGILKP